VLTLGESLSRIATSCVSIAGLVQGLELKEEWVLARDVVSTLQTVIELVNVSTDTVAELSSHESVVDAPLDDAQLRLDAGDARSGSDTPVASQDTIYFSPSELDLIMHSELDSVMHSVKQIGDVCRLAIMSIGWQNELFSRLASDDIRLHLASLSTAMDKFASALLTAFPLAEAEIRDMQTSVVSSIYHAIRLFALVELCFIHP